LLSYKLRVRSYKFAVLILFSAFLFVGAVKANVTVCQHFIFTWMVYGGGKLPLVSSSPPWTNNQLGIGDGSRIWSVTSNLAAGVQTVSGDAWCGASNSVAPTSHNPAGINCWCRRTVPGNGEWVYIWDYSPPNAFEVCTGHCSRHCMACVHEGALGACNRVDLLQ